MMTIGPLTKCHAPDDELSRTACSSFSPYIFTFIGPIPLMRSSASCVPGRLLRDQLQCGIVTDAVGRKLSMPRKLHARFSQARESLLCFGIKLFIDFSRLRFRRTLAPW